MNNNAQGAGAVTYAQMYEVDAKDRKAVRILNVANYLRDLFYINHFRNIKWVASRRIMVHGTKAPLSVGYI